MHVLITGLNGTLAPKVASHAVQRGWRISPWDRNRVPPADAKACNAFLGALQPDAIVHLAMGEEAWARLLATCTSKRNIPFAFTSTAMVFSHKPDGPHAPDDERTAADDYGRYKMRCEDAVLAANPSATVVRIGWQIHADDNGNAQGNNMLAHLDAQQARDGKIVASTLWRPACSFMDDTAEVLLGLIENPVAGVAHVDSNAIEGHAFDRIVAALKHEFKRDDWMIVREEGYRHDQRLTGGAVLVPGLATRLKALR